MGSERVMARLAEESHLEVPGYKNDSRRDQKCRTKELRAHCAEIEVLAEDLFVDMMSAANKVGTSNVNVLPGNKLRYQVRLRIRGTPEATIISEYSFNFQDWVLVEETRTSLVFRRRVNLSIYQASIQVQPADSGEELDYFIDASLATTPPVAGAS